MSQARFEKPYAIHLRKIAEDALIQQDRERFGEFMQDLYSKLYKEAAEGYFCLTLTLPERVKSDLVEGITASRIQSHLTGTGFDIRWDLVNENTVISISWEK